jgi:hypothetical protein
MTTYFLHLLQRLRYCADTPPFSHSLHGTEKGNCTKVIKESDVIHIFHTLNYPEPFSCIHTKQINYQTHVWNKSQLDATEWFYC